ncbi:MAG: hypothetical protein P4L36_06720, partial [Holophaga sp.]|nr:hypothetical protein [Holophaga sp.]
SSTGVYGDAGGGSVNEDSPCEPTHAAGRALLAAHFGPEALSWGPPAFQARGLEPWAAWSRSLDAARFAGARPAFPPLAALLGALERP